MKARKNSQVFSAGEDVPEWVLRHGPTSPTVPITFGCAVRVWREAGYVNVAPLSSAPFDCLAHVGEGSPGVPMHLIGGPTKWHAGALSEERTNGR